ncbi:MAG: AAA domain-containing protein [Candidatus Latescibacteria bacterium]|nr:AAA domain-containing protein [Candidatus Latescibacterota bacterium]
MNIRAEKINLDPEKLRQFLNQQQDPQDPQVQPGTAGGQTGQETQPPKEEWNFSLKPEELEAYLNQYAIGQYQAKAILATKICTHFNRLNLPPDEDEDIIGSIKNNILMIGPTGVGKTYLIKLIARHLGVPFVKGDATKFSETGYVGGDVEDLVRELVRQADGDVERAQYGIIYIDEIDKIASSRNQSGPDVSRSGVQRNLLKLMEETEVDLKAPHDLASQMETVVQIQRTGKVEREKVNTRNILFIVSGAFNGLEDIIGRRLNRGSMGFQIDPRSETDQDQEELLNRVRPDDLVEYGFESEFIGRLPVLAVLTNLHCEDLLSILRSPKSSVILSKKRDFRAYGIDLEFTDEALTLLAQRAFEQHTGARGLVGVFEQALIPFEKKLPSYEIDQFTLTKEIVEAPEAGLEKILFDHSLGLFIDRLHNAHGIDLDFTPEARQYLEAMARQRDQTPEELCDELLADYSHGLKLVEKLKFTVTRDILDTPQDTLNALIKEYYGRRTD